MRATANSPGGKGCEKRSERERERAVLTSGHGGGSGGSDGRSSSGQLGLGDVNPGEVAGPGEAAHLEVVAVAVVVLQGLVVDHVDDWDHEGEGVLLDPGQERLQPAGVALAVAVQVEDHVPSGGPGPG